MADKTQHGAPAAKTATGAEPNSHDLAPRDRLLSDDELGTITGGINPQPLPPRATNFW